MSEIRVDTITEKTSANGVAIDSVTLKDGGATLTDNITFSASGKGVHLGVTSATASNLLEDYEEGTWTPTLGDASGNNFTLNSSYSSFGYYTKVGRKVHIHCYIICTAINSASGSCRLSGLPFTNINNNRAYASGTIGYMNSLNLGDGKSLGFYVSINATSGFLFNEGKNSAGGGTATCAEISDNGEFMLNATYSTS